MITMTVCAGLFSHTPCNNDAFKRVQTDACEMGKALEVLHRNDTRYIAGFVDCTRKDRGPTPSSTGSID